MTVAQARHARVHRRPRHPDHGGGQALGPGRAARRAPASSTTWSARRPGPASSCSARIEHPRQRHYLNLYKLGEGPIYCFYTPYHLCHFEVPTTIARAALLGDATIAPIAGPLVEVVTLAKRDLKAGETIDELGGYTVYGEAETAAATARGGLLPIGVAVGATLRRDLPKDAVLTYADVEIPEGRLVDRLRREQDAMFGLERATAA